ncbi:MAG: 2-C-methyl-D-erythritol 4-phosphate cytidylyltransferase [Candidatus Omnitrophota bacterium]
MKKDTVVIILAGGTGRRMKTFDPKQFLILSGKPIIIQTIEAFEKNRMIAGTIIVCHKDHTARLKKLIKQYGLQKVLKVVSGGTTRQESAFKGLKAVSKDTKYVLIHDAVRPFIKDDLIRRVLQGTKKIGAAGPVVECSDTIVVKKGELIVAIPDRNTMKRIQTPQGFDYKIIFDAHKWALKNNIKNATDDCSLILAMGKPVKSVKGNLSNIKITESKDLGLAEKFMIMEK